VKRFFLDGVALQKQGGENAQAIAEMMQAMLLAEE
jgi:hypothetical protein